MQVDWSKAPEWANWAFTAEDRTWYWASSEPRWHKGHLNWSTIGRIKKMEPQPSCFFVNCESYVVPRSLLETWKRKHLAEHNEKARVDEVASVESTLSERGSRYGKFTRQARLSQALKNTMRLSDNWSKLAPHQIEALDMIQHKIARILNGDPNYDDSWRDIAGYATLIERHLNGEDI